MLMSKKFSFQLDFCATFKASLYICVIPVSACVCTPEKQAVLEFDRLRSLVLPRKLHLHQQMESKA